MDVNVYDLHTKICNESNMLAKIPASMYLSTTQVLHRDHQALSWGRGYPPPTLHIHTKDAYSNDVQYFGAQFTDLSVLVIHQLQQIVSCF